MSYARFSEGDVYLYPCWLGGWTCQMCKLPAYHEARFGCEPTEAWSVSLVSAAEVLQHLEAHVTEGHKVPDRALQRIKAEIEMHGGDWTFTIEEVE